MKYLPLIFRNVMRNKIRSLFTGSAIAVMLFIVVVLYSFLMMQDEMLAKNQKYHRIMATHVQGLTAQVPIAYVDRIRKLEGVRSAAPFSWFGGLYKDEKIQFAQFATDPEYIMDVLEEYTLPPDQLQAWKNDRTGCVVGSLIASNKGWNIGDKIVLKGNIYPCNLELIVRGIYGGGSTADREMLWFHYAYFDEALKERNAEQAGNAGIVMLRAESEKIMPDLMRRIDRAFASSDAPVRAMTEKEFNQSFTAMMGNVQGFIRYTSIAVVIALICVAANTMAMAMRERTREIALLKAIGFPQRSIMGMFLSESVLIGLFGGVLAGLGAKALFGMVNLSKWVPGLGLFYVPWTTALAATTLAAAIGLFSGFFPAWQAARVSVIDGLRKVV